MKKATGMGGSFSGQIRLTESSPEYAPVLRCMRIAMERAFIESGHGSRDSSAAAVQVARDIAALHGIDIDSLIASGIFWGSRQRQLRKLYYKDQQYAAKAGERLWK